MARAFTSGDPFPEEKLDNHPDVQQLLPKDRPVDQTFDHVLGPKNPIISLC